MRRVNCSERMVKMTTGREGGAGTEEERKARCYFSPRRFHFSLESSTDNKTEYPSIHSKPGVHIVAW